jgi:chemotaxis methyl-accepting protein methylase
VHSSGTSFFRDPEVFDRIATMLVPELLASKPHDEPLRAWCTSCTTGEDAYALAIVLVEELEARGLTRPVQVFATDADGEAIAHARHGVFSADIAAEVSSRRLDRFFHAFATGYRVTQALRNKVIFAPHDLVRDAPFARLDLILCRDVLASFDQVLQDRVTRSLQRALRPWGYLVIGASEMIVGGHLQRVHAAHPFYRSAGAPPPAVPPAARTAEDGDAPGQPATGPRAAARSATHAPDPRAAGTANEAEIGGGEPLRTALDELAAARHELIAIRDKLHHTREDTRQKLAALEQQAREQRDLLAATGLAVLFVDRELRILHHTPPLQQLIQVWPHDHGRPISDLASCLEYRELAGDLRQVLDTLAPIECEIRDRTGRPFLVRLSPHRSGNEVIGAVATFVDITQVRGAAMQRRAAAR